MWSDLYHYRIVCEVSNITTCYRSDYLTIMCCIHAHAGCIQQLSGLLHAKGTVLILNICSCYIRYPRLTFQINDKTTYLNNCCTRLKDHTHRYTHTHTHTHAHTHGCTYWSKLIVYFVVWVWGDNYHCYNILLLLQYWLYTMIIGSADKPSLWHTEPIKCRVYISTNGVHKTI